MKKLLLLVLVSGMAANGFAQPEVSEKWVITPVTTMKGVLGMLDINFPADVERNILIYQQADNKFLRSVSHNDKTYTIAPGEYRFTLTNVPVENVPIKKGHETRLKAGFLDIVSEGDWHLYDETKEKAYTSGNNPKKLPLPVGSYQVKLGGQFYPVIIKDGETVEDYTPIQVKDETQDQKKLPIIDTAQWQRDVRLTNNSASSSTSFNNARCIAINGPYVHVVWRDTRDGIYEIFYKRSTDGGASWGADTRLTRLADHASASELPSVAVSGSVVHVVWDDYQDGNYELYYKRSTDAGSSWGTDTRLTKETYKRISNDTAQTKFPSVAVSGNDVHVVWRDDRDGHYEIYYKNSTTGGISWGTDKRLTHHTAAYSYRGFPSVAVSGNIVHVVWRDDRDGNLEIYYKRSVDRGSSWGTVTRLTNNSFSSVIPSVSVSGSNVHVVWYDSRDEISENENNEIYYKSSTDGGISWGADIRLTDNSFRSEIPSVVVSGSNVHVVWCDNRDGNHEIYYKHSTDGGISWGPDAQLTNSDANYFCGYPSVAVSGKVVHVVWTDYRDGNREIYYKRNSGGKADSSTVSANNKWVITPVPTMKGVLGALDINFPADIERDILIYQQADSKFLRSVSRNDKTYTIAPGEYRFTLTNVPVENVPIKKGHETRLKAGFLNIVSEGDWHLYDETKEKAYTSGNKPKKLPLPVGSYQIKLGGQFYPVVIKDRETEER